MKVLLINPKLTRRPVRLNIPVSLLYVGTALWNAGHDVDIIDANNMADDDFEDELTDALRPRDVAVGLSVMTAQVPSAMDISRRVKRISESPVIWGGVHPTLYPEQVAGSDYVDYILQGEGEQKVVELVNAISLQRYMRKIVVGGAFDINQLSYPRWELLEDVRQLGLKEVARRTGIGLPLLTSRGCPHRCAFCICPSTKLKYRFRSAELVLEDIERIIESGIHSISFWDEDFFANKKRLIEILDGIERNGWHFEWFGTARADYFRESHIDPLLVKRLKRCGCRHLGIGAESGSQRVLDMLKKDITVEDTINTAEILDWAGINADFSFMIGLPDEAYADMRATVRLVERIARINNHFRILGPFVYRPYPGAELYNKCLEQGLEEPHTLAGWVNSPFINDKVGRGEYHLYSWVTYPIGKLQKLMFYCWLAGLRVRSGLLTRIGRSIGQWRCRNQVYLFPVEMWLHRLVTGLNLGVSRLSTGKFG